MTSRYVSGPTSEHEAVGSEYESPIFVVSTASPIRLANSVAKRMRSWTNAGSSSVSRHISSGLRMSIAIVHGPTSTAPSALGNFCAESASHCSRNAGSRACLNDGLGLLGQIVERDHDVRLIALVVIDHRRHGLLGVRAVLLDREAVQAAGKGAGDRVRGHAVGALALVGGGDALTRRDVTGLVHGHHLDCSIGTNASRRPPGS